MFLFSEDFFEFSFQFVYSEATGKDGAVGGEEDGFGESIDAVEVSRYFLSVKYLRIRYLHFIDGFHAMDNKWLAKLFSSTIYHLVISCAPQVLRQASSESHLPFDDNDDR